MLLQIGEIEERVPSVPPNAKCETVDRIFRASPELQGVVVTERNIPAALIMRNRFYQQIGTLYGYNVFMKRTVALLMDKEPLLMDYGTPITEVSKLAMDRPAEHLYDYVIVLREGHFYGVVSIRDLLLSFAEIQAEAATSLNPLTQLPGNKSIDLWLERALREGPVSVLYIDLDYFKSYNDTYGFAEGDRMIIATAALLNKAIARDNGWLGHIGGDDFIIGFAHYSYKRCCREILDGFEELLPAFYRDEHLRSGCVWAENRKGEQEEIPIVSISIAVVTNRNRDSMTIGIISEEAARLKKKCKAVRGSCCLDGDIFAGLG